MIRSIPVKRILCDDLPASHHKLVEVFRLLESEYSLFRLQEEVLQESAVALDQAMGALVCLGLDHQMVVVELLMMKPQPEILFVKVEPMILTMMMTGIGCSHH